MGETLMTAPKIVSPVSRAEVKFSDDLDPAYVLELQRVLDKAAELANTDSPTSSSIVEGKIMVRGRERNATLQSSKFPELFDLLSGTSFFRGIHADFFSSLIDLETTIDLFKALMREDKDSVKRILTKAKLGFDDVIGVLSKIQEKYGAFVSPQLLNADPASYIRNSDLINNILFVRTSGVVGSMKMEEEMA